MSDVAEKLEKMLGATATAVWLFFILLNIVHELGLAQVAGEVGGLPLLLPSLEVEQVGQAILRTVYTIFLYVLAFVTIVAGIQAALGFVRTFITTFVPITIPAGSLNTLIRTVIGLYLIKYIVDVMLRYWGVWTPSSILEVMAIDYASWTFIATALVGILLGVLLVRLVTRGEEVVEFE